MEYRLKSLSRPITDVLTKPIANELQANGESVSVQSAGYGQRRQARCWSITYIGTGERKNIFYLSINLQLIISDLHRRKGEGWKQDQIHFILEKLPELLP